MTWLIIVAAGLFETGFAVSLAKLVSIGLILTGVIGLSLSGVTHP